MKIKGKLITEKNKADLLSTYIPDTGSFADIEEKERPIVTYEAMTSQEYSRIFLNFGVRSLRGIDLTDIALPRITKIENFELEDGTKIETGED